MIQASWAFSESGVLFGANGSLPRIIFQRDRQEFDAEFAGLEIQEVRPFMSLRYLVSGGVSLRPLMPEATLVSGTDLRRVFAHGPIIGRCAMIHLKRR
jgi:hypothetical protein